MITEIKIQTLRESNIKEYTLNEPSKILSFWKDTIEKSSWYDTEKECLIVFCLDTNLNIKAYSLVSLGLVNETVCHAREVFRAAILNASTQIIIAHNHPSGNPSPSSADISMTRRLKQAGEIIGISLIDSIIIGNTVFSLKEQGLI